MFAAGISSSATSSTSFPTIGFLFRFDNGLNCNSEAMNENESYSDNSNGKTDTGIGVLH
jgi:hypothetical protein